MNVTLTLIMMLCMFLIMGVLPIFVFLGIGGPMGASVSDPRLILAMFLFAGVVAFVASFGIFLLAQKTDCGKIQNTQTALTNASFALVIQLVVLTLVWLIPPLKGVVGNLLPADADANLRDGISYGYFSAFAGVFSMLLGANLAGTCN